MKQVFKIENKTVTLICDALKNEQDIPVIILNTFDEDGQEIWNQIKKLTDEKCILVTIANIDWNKEMSPWYMKRLYAKEEDYAGEAEKYLKQLTEKIIPQLEEYIKNSLKNSIRYYILAGYSLAGLFAIYSLYQTDAFQRVVSCSGSMWYPNFIEFVKQNSLKALPNKIYFSLGDKESKTKNEMMAKVEENTKWLAQFYSEKGIETVYEENEGNHFQNVSPRIAKGICWSMKEKEVE